MNALDYILAVKESATEPFVTIVRGIPGSGKTTLALSTHIAAFAADDFFMNGTEYKFDGKMMKHAHAYCISGAALELYHGRSVIIHNTFSQDWELDEVRFLVEKFQCPLLIVTLNTQFESVHNVPAYKIAAMSNRFASSKQLTIPSTYYIEHEVEEKDFTAMLLVQKW